MVRELSPHSRSLSADTSRLFPASRHMIDADHFVRGEGIVVDARYLGEDPDAPDATSGNRLRH